jgi:hypothetical protein
MGVPVDQHSPFYVPPALDVLGKLVRRFPGFWRWLGDCESTLLAPRIAHIVITKPVYVCGLARSGSTLLHEVIAAHPGVATHRIKDYPFISTPYWCRSASPVRRATAARERPHRDKMMITPESPDAIEEMLWLAFFPHCHDPKRDNRLQAQDRNLRFDAYYLNHLRKLLLVESASRYVAKANYHVARLGYLLRLFPEARFVIPIRSPVGHIASLARQHQWFSAGHRESPRSLAVMQQSGHFEFGLDRRPMNLGDGDHVRQIESAWASGNEILGWAHYWDMVYRYLADLLEAHPEIGRASIVVRFEELCQHPRGVLQRVLEHCNLPHTTTIIDKFAPGIRCPNYYQHSFTAGDLATIQAATANTAQRWRIDDPNAFR